MAKSAPKRGRGRPRSKPDEKIAARHSVNYLASENEEVERAAASEGERSVGRWVGRVALVRARQINSGKG